MVDRQVDAHIFLLADSDPPGSCETAVESTSVGATKDRPAIYARGRNVAPPAGRLVRAGVFAVNGRWRTYLPARS